MNSMGTVFLGVAALMTLILPRRQSVLPFLLSTVYMTEGQQLDIAGAHFTIPRLLVAVGFLRILIKRERIAEGLQTIDKLMLLWGGLLIGMSAFHSPPAWVYRTGIVWTELGCYILFRVAFRSLDDVRQAFKFLAFALLPLAALMLLEKSSGLNPFSILGGVSEMAAVRNGDVRASGPFSHAILAGTVGAATAAIGLSLWSSSRRHALCGCTAGLSVLYASTSSGPILMLAFTVFGLYLWRFRNRMRLVRGLLLATMLALILLMKAPIYFLIARIDIVGGSQGWFRAKLIDSAIDHLSEWWLFGTDYTRHWMATGIAASERHTDMTNHLLTMGVNGGLPLMLTFILVLVTSFNNVGRAIRRRPEAPADQRLFIWTLGALLFGFLMNFLSITMFDQSVVFFWLTIAAIACVAAEQPPLVETAALKGPGRPALRHKTFVPGEQKPLLSAPPRYEVAPPNILPPLFSRSDANWRGWGRS